MIRIPSGWCWIGSEARYASESPRHRVFIATFDISPVTVLRSEYETFLREESRETPRDWSVPGLSDPDQPVVGVNWYDAMAYCGWLSKSTGAPYRLPSEAEWERASRGGTDDLEYSWGNEPPGSLERYQCNWPGPQRAAEGSPNAYGLFHMGDNVHEWCLDWYSPEYYAVSPQYNPKGPDTGTRRASRGGSWRHQVKAARLAHRSSLPPEFRYNDYGFRIVRDVQAGGLEEAAHAAPNGLFRVPRDERPAKAQDTLQPLRTDAQS